MKTSDGFLNAEPFTKLFWQSVWFLTIFLQRKLLRCQEICGVAEETATENIRENFLNVRSIKMHRILQTRDIKLPWRKYEGGGRNGPAVAAGDLVTSCHSTSQSTCRYWQTLRFATRYVTPNLPGFPFWADLIVDFIFSYWINPHF